MRTTVSISVKETLPELHLILKQCPAEASKRINMLIVLKTNPGISKTSLSEESNMSLNSIRKWGKRYNEVGIISLQYAGAIKPGGRTTCITTEIHNAIGKWFNNPASSRFTDLYAWINKTYPLGIKLNSLRKYVAKHFKEELQGIKILHTDITETFAELESLYEKCSPFMKTRIKMLLVLKKENNISRTLLADKAGIAYNSAVKWHKIYKQGGIEKLLEVKRGKGRWDKHSVFNFPPEVFDAIEKRHAKKPFTSYMQLFRWTLENYLPEIKYAQLLKHVHNHFGDNLNIDKSVKLHIAESVEELNGVYTNSPNRIKLRVKMLITLLQNQNFSIADLAKHVGVTYGSIAKWQALYQKRGLTSLLGLNHSSIITKDLHKLIGEKLIRGEFITFASLYAYIKKNHVHDMNYNTLHRYVTRNFKPEMVKMRMVIKSPINESLESLMAIKKTDSTTLNTRVNMLILLKKNPTIKIQELSDKLHTSKASLKKWCYLYESGGINTLMHIGQRGRKKFIMPQKLHSSIEKYLGKNPDMSIKELHKYIKPTYPKPISYNKLYWYVRTNINKLAIKKGAKKHAA